MKAPQIFKYLDYRIFLKERFAFLKKTKRATFRSLGQKAGFASPNFLKLVIEGHRNLTSKSIPKVAAAFKLNEKETEFFAALVHFNQAKTPEAKDQAYETLKSIRRELPLKPVEQSQFKYFDEWHMVAIREMLGLKDFVEDAHWICEKLQGKITPAKARKALRLLEKLGLIHRDAQGRLQAQQKPLTVREELNSLSLYRFHNHMIQLAQESLNHNHHEQRDISALTLSVSEERFRQIKSRIRQFRQEILSLANNDPQAKAVYQLNFQFFNLTEVPWHS